MERDESQHLGFSGHETFPFRYGWPAKGVRGVMKDAQLFSREDALVRLGVGKNMVKSIRHWCQALGLVTTKDDQEHALTPTPFGRRLFAPDGLDPYIEHPATPWLLHWQLVRAAWPASTWHLGFTCWNGSSFEREELIAWLEGWSNRARGRATRGSIKRDVEVFLRTYLPSRNTKDLPPEEVWDSPLVELGLLREGERGVVHFVRGQQAALPDPVFFYALVDFWQTVHPRQASISFDELAWGPGSPGMAFRLSEEALVQRLEHLPALHGLGYDETAGLRQVAWSPRHQGLELLMLLDSVYAAAPEQAE